MFDILFRRYIYILIIKLQKLHLLTKKCNFCTIKSVTENFINNILKPCMQILIVHDS